MRMTLKQIAEWAMPKTITAPAPVPAVTHTDEFGKYLDMVHRKFIVFNPSVNTADCNFCIGDEGIPDQVRNEIISARSHLHGVPVAFVPGAVGALMIPPNYKSATLQKAKQAPKKIRTQPKKD